MTALLLPGDVDKGSERVGKSLRLLTIREMAGVRDQLKPGVRDRATPFFAIVRSDDPVFGAPQQQSRAVDSMQPTLEPGVVHVRLPAVEGESLSAANDSC